ncbi:MAG: PspC domain-containing protein [Spirosomataceae bacterium]
MKKTIQINIAGIVFNIEEDAFDKLSGYLKSVQQYFSDFEGSEEIVSDIESRVAEKFLAKQKAENHTVVTLENVNALIKEMGTVADFEAIQEDEDLKKQEARTEKQETRSSKQDYQNKQSNTIPTKIYRDTKRKGLGGVLAGLSHHWQVDVVWIRILFLVLFLGLLPAAGISGFLFLGYFIAWIVLPPNANLEENTNIKKFYRDSDNNVIGGVSSGLAAYFGTDVVIFRLIFVALIFAGGLGIILYIILWAVAPTAQTLTQKMEMKGEAVTLENIETKIKESKNPTPAAPESAITKLLLFPFRLIGLIFKAIGKVLMSLGPIVRIFAGLILLVISGSFMIAFMAVLGVFLGVSTGSDFDFGVRGNIEWITQDIHPAFSIFAILASLMPIIAIGMVGLILITNRRLGNRSFWTGIFTAWMVGVLGTIIIATKYQLNFARRGEVEETKTFTLPSQTLVLDADNSEEYDDNNDFRFRNEVDVEIEGFDGNEIKVEQTFKARGRTTEEARANAKNITYKIAQKDSSLIFDRYIGLPSKGRFRQQELDLKLYIPYNKKFKMTEYFYNRVYRHWGNDQNYDVDGDEVDKFTFVMKRDSGVVCLDCPKLTDEERESLRSHYDDDDSYIDYDVFNRNGEHDKTFTVKDFDKISVGGAFILNIKKGDTYSVKAESDDRDELDNLDLRVSGRELKIEFEDEFRFRNRDRVVFTITMPNFEGIDLSGAASAKVIGFKDNKDIDIDLTGASRIAIDIDANAINFDATGASSAELRGKAAKVDFDVTGASKVDARRMDIVNIDANASGASKIKVGKTGNLDSNTSGASKVIRD